MVRGRKEEKDRKRRKLASRYKFTDKKHPIQGVISVITGICILTAMLVMYYISSLSHGNGGMVLGIGGLVSMVCAAVGIVFAVKGLKVKEIYYLCPVIGIVLNSILFLGYFVLYMIGIAL